MKASVYDCKYRSEERRLLLQENSTKKVDTRAVRFIEEKNKLKNRENCYILDIGCGYGGVSRRRFSKHPNAKILGIDKNTEVMQNLNQQYKNTNCRYASFDIASETFEQDFEAFLKENNYPKFDVIIFAYVLQHLADPCLALRKVKKFLAKDGFVFVRGGDDGNKLAYNDDGLVKQVIDLYLEAEGVSDRFNGRKIYSQLLACGYKKPRLFFETLDTSAMSATQKRDLFFQTFSYRINVYDYLYKNYCKNPAIKKKKYDVKNAQIKKNRKLMTDLLAQLRKKFLDPEFWYAETQVVGIAQNSED